MTADTLTKQHISQQMKILEGKTPLHEDRGNQKLRRQLLYSPNLPFAYSWYKSARIRVYQ